MNERSTGENTCVFCRIAAGDVPAEIVHQDEEVVAFLDKHPKAPVHILIIPRRHIASVNEIQPGDEKLIGRLFTVARRLAEQQDIHGQGYRLVTNTGDDGGQTVFHLHIHLLGGKPLGSF